MLPPDPTQEHVRATMEVAPGTPIAPPGAGVNVPTEPAKGNGLGLWLRDIVISAAVSILIITFLYQPVRVEGTSMLPRLEDHDRLFINKFVYRISSIHRGDVVVFHYPRDPEKSYIKRVIGLPGDRISIDRGRVYVNGTLVSEPYVPGVPRYALTGGDDRCRGCLFH